MGDSVPPLSLMTSATAAKIANISLCIAESDLNTFKNLAYDMLLQSVHSEANDCIVWKVVCVPIEDSPSSSILTESALGNVND